MADWTTSLPPASKEGDTNHIEVTNAARNAILEIRTLVDSGALNGKDGAKGATGAAGAKGDKGDKGDTGATGATGAKGADGKDLSAELAALTARVEALETPAG